MLEILINKWLYLLCFQHSKSFTEEEMEVEKLKQELQEKEKLISGLQAQLTQAQAEQAAQVRRAGVTS